MSKRATFWLAWFTWVLYVATAIVTLLFQIKNAPSELLSDLFGALVLLTFATVGSLIASRRPQNPIGWIFCTGTLLWGLGIFLLEYAVYALMTVPGSLPAGALLGVFGDWTRGMGWFLVLTFLLLLFPNGHLPSPRWRSVAWLIAGLLAAYSITLLLSPYPYSNIDPRLAAVRNPLGILVANNLFDQLANLSLLLLYPTIFVCIVAVFLRFRRAQGEERQQLKWFAYGTTLSILMLIVIVILMFSNVKSGPLATISFYLAVVCIPISAGIAMLRYRLYDIDVLINRTLVYGLLTTSIVGIYVLVVVSLGTLLRAEGNLLISLLATGLVAVLFQPLRERLQRGVNRLLYGQRDEPYTVIARLSQRLKETLAPDAVLSTIAETVAQALKLPYTAILWKQGETFELAASYGRPAGEPLTIPLVYQTEIIGQLQLAPRSPGEAFTPADVRLLDELARQAGLAAHAVRLATDLQKARERLVLAREEERRRLRRDLHDGVGPTLASLSQRIDTACHLVSRDPDAAIILLSNLKTQVKSTISDIRRVVYALRPPILDELGLVSAIREYIMHLQGVNGLHVSVEAPADVPPLPAAVEVAAYRIALEALTNIERHAHAQHCIVRLELADEQFLCLSITDDGRGLPGDYHVGVGITSMRERVAELGGEFTLTTRLGGGTRVQVRLPLKS